MTKLSKHRTWVSKQPCKICGCHRRVKNTIEEHIYCYSCHARKRSRKLNPNFKLKAEKLKKDLEIAKETNSYEDYDI